ncbi:unnamed protein product [Soboliphyme baturini]|uniref:Phosphatase tensin-type domain-containing protein n=1 Tax=Soboliphyme baturini TaxID=241478 RepID=A0A183IRI7_9BILA|nr:unnamed protein product [Soboliphyme baturini]
MLTPPSIAVMYNVLTFPADGDEFSYRISLRHVSRMLHTKLARCYKIFNVSRPRDDLMKLNQDVVEFGWPPNMAPPLQRVCSLCKEIDQWLARSPHNVAVIHEKGGSNRAAVVINVFLHYCRVCAKYVHFRFLYLLH